VCVCVCVCVCVVEVSVTINRAGGGCNQCCNVSSRARRNMQIDKAAEIAPGWGLVDRVPHHWVPGVCQSVGVRVCVCERVYEGVNPRCYFCPTVTLNRSWKKMRNGQTPHSLHEVSSSVRRDTAEPF